MSPEIIKKKHPMQWSYYEAVRINGRTMKDVAMSELMSMSMVEKLVIHVENLLALKDCWYDELSTRVVNAIMQAGCATKKETKTAILENRLNPGIQRNYGCKSHYELCKFLGLVPPDPVKKKPPSGIWRCPHCQMFVDEEEHKKVMW
jgi:hypothetical protein